MNFIILFHLIINSALANQFKVLPYSLQTSENKVSIHFELTQQDEIIIEQIALDKTELLYEGLARKNELFSELSKSLECDETHQIVAKSISNGKILFSKTINAPQCLSSKTLRPFKFGFISDTQQYNERHLAISKTIEQKLKLSETQFILNTGDIVQEGNRDEDWKQFLNTGNIYMGKVPLIAAIGNHDYRGTKGKNLIPEQFKKFLRYGKDKNDLGDMVIDFGQFRLMVFNSNYFKLTRKAESKQLKWIIDEFEDAKRSNVPMIVSMHYPIYSSSMNRFTSGSVRKMRKNLDPLFREYNIPLVLSGHTHMYERSYRDGVHYVVAGPAGGRINKPSFKNKYQRYFNPNVLTYTEITVSNGLIDVCTFDEQNNQIDKVQITIE